MEQAEDVPGDVLDRHAARQLRLHVGQVGAQQVLARLRLAFGQRAVEQVQAIRFVVGHAPDHHFIHEGELRDGFLHGGQAAIECDAQLQPLALEPVDPVVTQRRDLAVLLRRQPAQPGLARMHDEIRATRRRHRVHEGEEAVVVLLLVHAEPALHRHRDAHRLAHGRDAFRDQRRFPHQAGAEAARLHAVGRAADVEVDLVVAPVRADAGRLGQQRGVAAAKLQRHRMLAPIEAEQALTVAVDHCLRVNHLGIQQRARRQHAMEGAAVAVGPVHHRGDRELGTPWNAGLMRVSG